MKRYINLNTHSNYSFGETVVTPAEIIEFAIKDGAEAIALTDLNSVHGLSEFAKAAEKHRAKGIKPIYGVQIFAMDTDRFSAPRKITLLAKNRNGLKNIYKIMSLGYMKILSDVEWPCVSYQDILDNRESVLVGYECTESDVHRVWARGGQNYGGKKADELVLEEYAAADYVEIRPWHQYKGITGGIAGEPEEAAVKLILNEIVRCVEAADKLAVAANGSSCITKQDELCFNILHDNSSETQSKSAPFLTTEEMLDEYGLSGLSDGESSMPEFYAGSAMARKLVLDNTNAIAEMIEGFSIEENIQYSFRLPDAEEILMESSEKVLHEKYGENVPKFIMERYESEIKNIRSNGFASSYVRASMLAEKSRGLGYLHNLRGCAPGSFVVYLMGISESNPLPPHYYCPNCRRTELVDAKEYPSGFDLNGYAAEKRNCLSCGGQLVGDGHNIPVEFFAGYDGDKAPDFNFNFASEIQNDAVEYLGKIEGEGKTFCAGSKRRFPYSIAESLAANYCSEHNIRLMPDEKERIKDRLSSVLMSNGRFPEKILIVPDGKEIFDFSPVGYSERSQIKENMKPSAFIDFYELPLEMYFIAGLGMFSKLRLMEEMTGISAKTIKFEEIDTQAFFCGDSFKGLPFDGDFVREIIGVLPATKFSDLVRIYGFAHGTGVWAGNGEDLIAKGFAPGELISHREDIMLTLVRNGVDRKTAFHLAAMVCKGKVEKCLTTLREHNIPEWYIESMRKIRYLFPKSHAVEYVTNYLRMIWYKIYYPAAFYAAVLTVDAADFDHPILAEGKKRIELELNSIYQARDADPDCGCQNDEEAEKHKDTMELALECYEKGIVFLPGDMDLSDPHRFVPEGNAIRLPINCPKQGEQR